MATWADYLVSKVVYDPSHLIFRAIRHQDTENGIGAGTVVDRLTISSDIASGKNYITIYNTSVSWKKGHKIQTFRINGEPYLRIDNNKTELDFLGDIPVLQGYESELKQLLLQLRAKAHAELKEPPTEPPLKLDPESAPKLEIPKEPPTAEPKPETIQKEEPKPEPEPTPKPNPKELPPPAPSPRGSLPKDTDTELPQELELLPEPDAKETTKPEPPKEEPSPEYTTKEQESAEPTELDNLKSQLDDLENSLTDIKSQAGTIPDEKIKKSGSQPNSKTGKKSKLKKKPDRPKKKLKKPASTQSKPQTQPAIQSSELMAYCVKCKEKRQIADAQNTTMKNGRSAVKGACAVCGCKVFRIVKNQS